MNANMIKKGQTLPNGATVLDISHRTNYGSSQGNKDYYVLCQRSGSSCEQYVTWWVDPAKPDSTSSGRYSKDYLSALDDFISRCGHVNERGLNFHREQA
tara:strand:- start:101 stop:397 length:297 start_codon:yes stop_codon:yes gene_type:complete